MVDWLVGWLTSWLTWHPEKSSYFEKSAPHAYSTSRVGSIYQNMLNNNYFYGSYKFTSFIEVKLELRKQIYSWTLKIIIIIWEYYCLTYGYITCSISNLPWMLSLRLYTVNAHRPRIGSKVKDRILSSCRRFPVSVSGSLRHIPSDFKCGGEKYGKFIFRFNGASR